MLPICGKTRGYYRNEVATGLEDRVFDGVKNSSKQIAGLEDDFFSLFDGGEPAVCSLGMSSFLWSVHQ